MGTGEPTPMKDVKVTLSGNEKQYKRTTDLSGSYAVSDVAPGNYKLSVEISGYRTSWPLEEVTVAAKGCAVANVAMKVDRRVHGVVRNGDGLPVAGVLVQLVPKNRNPQHRLHAGQSVSDERGQYEIDGISPGDYYLGINIGSAPTKEYPYPPVDYPNTHDVRQAIPIAFMTGPLVQSFELTAPERLPVIKLRGRIE